MVWGVGEACPVQAVDKACCRDTAVSHRSNPVLSRQTGALASADSRPCRPVCFAIITSALPATTKDPAPSSTATPAVVSVNSFTVACTATNTDRTCPSMLDPGDTEYRRRHRRRLCWNVATSPKSKPRE